ncbi:MAG: adenylosuccinate synthetase, partial [Bacteroidota bacterium]
LSGVTELIMMKSDVLSGMESIHAGTGYRLHGSETSEVPFGICEEGLEPVYKTFPGWDEDITRVTDFTALPSTLQHYISFVETELGLPLKVISVGPSREQTIIR